MADLTHLGAALARQSGPDADGAEYDHWGGERVPAAARAINDAMATQYVQHLRAGDGGAAIRLLHRLRHEDGADPWRLLEAAVAQALAPAAQGGRRLKERP